MKKIHGHLKKISYGQYLAFITLFLLLAAIFITINNALQKQAIHTKAASDAAALPPGSVGPSEAQCAEQVIKTPENIPDNQTANNTNLALQNVKLTGSKLGTYGAPYEQRVTGNFSGTTDEILQWGACKWGFDADTARGMAAGLSKWKQSALADCNNQGQIQPETNGCQSVGIMRVKAANIPPTHPGMWPYAKTSTAFNVDYALGYLRACYDGKTTDVGQGNAPYAAGDLNGCIGAWYSGAWHDGSAEGFILGVENIIQTKEWTTYAGTQIVSPILSTAPLPTTPAANPTTPAANPTFGVIAPCPSCSVPTITPAGSGTLVPTSSAIVPTGSVISQAPTEPCPTDGSISDNAHRPGKHKKHNGDVSNNMEALLKFFLQLITLLLQLLGGGQVNNPNPLPSPVPSSEPAISGLPCDPSVAPVTSAPVVTSAPIISPVISSAVPSPAVSPVPSQTAVDTSPSGEAMPKGDLPGWKQIFAEDFTVDAATGTWGSDSDAKKVVYTGATGTKWVTYPKTYTDTYQKRPYRSDQVLSVHNGVLDFFLHNVDGQPAGANPSPLVDGTQQYQTYGRYSARFKVDTNTLSEYYVAWLLWPQTESDWQCAESDYPEGHLNSNVGGFAHYGCSGSQDAIDSTAKFTEWHTYTQEWKPGVRNYYLDNKLIGTSTNSVYDKPQRWQLQTETNGSGTNQGHLLVDWVTVYSYQP